MRDFVDDDVLARRSVQKSMPELREGGRPVQADSPSCWSVYAYSDIGHQHDIAFTDSLFCGGRKK